MAALDAMDDRVALVDGCPVAVDSLWRTLLRSLDCESREGLIVVHPSWWPATRIGVVTAAAETVVDGPNENEVVARPRSWLLTQASPDAGPEVPVVVEIAERLVAVAGAEVVAVPRRAEPRLVAEEVAGLIAGMTPAVVLIDAPSTVAGAAALATLIADAVRLSGGQNVVEIDDARLLQLARSVQDGPLGRGRATV